MKVITFVKNKYQFLLSVCLCLLITATTCFAVPGNPGDGLCDGEDGGPDGCPLDTWVIALVIIAFIFTILHLRRKQKSLQA
ncbi:hypothetical protein [Mucilaginibacter sp. SP1R1]|uniref:hypothetical protein n=1 Tax=Mucilaginibacter sp. SP1R1 TaxID=2723091 RepID=UPI0016178293|nr:hypothetical protein [Mucilaginibacter sp. SP1R1]MBB6149241.1 hypothetical protein [Mucilaginibacter sp. SP1R1]